MKTVFEIIPETINTENCSLCCELTLDSFSYAIRNDEENKIVSVGVYQYDKNKPQSGFAIALQILFHQHSFLSEKFKKCCLIYSVPRSVLVPFTMYNSQKNAEVLNLIHGDLAIGETIIKDILPQHDLYNTYSVPAVLNNTVYQQFPTIRGMHQYSLFLKKQNSEEDKLSAVFYPEKLVVTLYKEGAYHLLNTYSYRTPEDVAYILLNICRQFNVSDIPILVGGLIEEDSALFKKIYNYFTNVSLAVTTDEYLYEEGITQFPLHFFNHFFEFDLCE
ncbi:MAG: DUF3822 family protein [Ginsengibacter sp.]